MLAKSSRQRPDPRTVVGQSPEWIDTLKKATQVAETETTVLLTGESAPEKKSSRGSSPRLRPKGRTVHRVELRRAAEQLLESELFGLRAGRVPGAHSQPGQIDLAAGGVLFLDESAR